MTGWIIVLVVCGVALYLYIRRSNVRALREEVEREQRELKQSANRYNDASGHEVQP